MTPTADFRIAGAGPAGMSAAILLAEAGYRVQVFEQRAVVGARFNDDFQGLENWTTPTDAHEELGSGGIRPTWWNRPFHGGSMYDPLLRRREVTSERPLFYMVRRGASHPGSLDCTLYKQALERDVQFRFNERLNPEAADVIATGPRGKAFAVAAGMTFRFYRDPLACVILSETLAPAGYVYFLVSDGQATLATVLFREFRRARACLHHTMRALEQLFGVSEFPGSKYWGGYGAYPSVSAGSRIGALQIGEGAGFQDFLFGFGIRNAILSGVLAARSLIEHRSYAALCQERLSSYVKASLVNRALYESGGDLAKKILWHWAGGSTVPHRVMQRLYNFSDIRKLLYPILIGAQPS